MPRLTRPYIDTTAEAGAVLFPIPHQSAMTRNAGNGCLTMKAYICGHVGSVAAYENPLASRISAIVYTLAPEELPGNSRRWRRFVNSAETV
jgi:hypothetical protein